ncbi:hypothetical protein TNCT_291891 [Trichonephila clavata]|uniref:Uncharacterized protein n=1 Tax=Trichonephila clavata TaxID=2740835 RepID=A0A8X6KTN9_TRICU|nr:hypothetical protein TNCT_291891 [Trichonephila clavata]
MISEYLFLGNSFHLRSKWPLDINPLQRNAEDNSSNKCWNRSIKCYCIALIREGEPCPLEPRGLPPTRQCEEGTTCKSTDDGLKCVRNCYSE